MWYFMNVDEAKLLLETLRPGRTESEDPRVAEALALARENAILNEWLTAQRQFDRDMALQLNSIPVPPALHSQLLQLPRQRFKARFLRHALALAACLGILALVGQSWWESRPVDFASLRQHILDQSWGTSPHLALRSGRWDEVRSWLSGQNLATDFQVPSALENAKLRGCNIVRWHGHSIPVLCLTEGHRHMHLYVVDRMELVDVPKGGGAPVLANYGALPTFSWTRADRAYVLTGFNAQAFLKKFRKSGHWLLTT
jgi:hypothetical protein